MKILILNPGSGNSGDLVVLKGTINILKEIFPHSELIPYILEEKENYVPEFISCDLLVLCGTPWFWELLHRSIKYAVLEKILNLYNDIPKVGFGLGSCYPLSTKMLEHVKFSSTDTWQRADGMLVKKIYSEFKIIFTRDIMAKKYLDFVGVENTLLTCPSVFAFSLEDCQPSKKPLLIFHDPSRGVSKEVCGTEFVESYINFQKYFYDNQQPDVITMSGLDCDFLRDVWGLQVEKDYPYSTMVKTAEDLEVFLRNHNPVLSGRVHGAVPSQILGNTTFLLPVDSRFLTATEVGVEPIFTFGNPNIESNLKRPSQKGVREKVEIARQIISKRLRELL